MECLEIYGWLIVFIMLIIIEASTFQLVTIWFAIGAAAAFIAAMLSVSLEVQLIIFLSVSMLLLILLRPLADRYLKKRKPEKTNADSLIGDYATVTAKIHNSEGFGKAVVRGLEWTAAAENEDDVIEAGSRVKIVGIKGVKLIVAR